jgi:hypothetical protein
MDKNMKKKLLLVFLLFFCLTGVAAEALSDFSAFGPDWDFYYLTYKITGYPVYNVTFQRYDFYDLDDSYCGSLSFNVVLDKWEYCGL